MSASRKKRRPLRGGAVEPDMNVTPLVDVVLVLLIIFMVVAPKMEQDVPVDLPGIFNPDPDAKAAMDPIKLSVDSGGTLHLESRPLDLDGAIGALAERHAEEPLRRLVLRADARLRYGTVRPILSRVQQVGFPGLSLMVGERRRPAEAPEPADSEPVARAREAVGSDGLGRDGRGG